MTFIQPTLYKKTRDKKQIKLQTFYQYGVTKSQLGEQTENKENRSECGAGKIILTEPDKKLERKTRISSYWRRNSLIPCKAGDGNITVFIKVSIQNC